MNFHTKYSHVEAIKTEHQEHPAGSCGLCIWLAWDDHYLELSLCLLLLSFKDLFYFYLCVYICLCGACVCYCICPQRPAEGIGSLGGQDTGCESPEGDTLASSARTVCLLTWWPSFLVPSLWKDLFYFQLHMCVLEGMHTWVKILRGFLNSPQRHGKVL